MDRAVQEIQRKRFAFLQYLYEATGGDTTQILSTKDIAAELGLSQKEEEQIAVYLAQERLVELLSPDGISIAHAGVKELEEAVARPEHPTDHFAPLNMIHIQNMTNSQIQQGTEHSQQHGAWERADYLSLVEIARAIREELAHNNLNQESAAEAEADLSVIEAQARSPRPKDGMIREGLASLRSVLESAAGNTTSSRLPELLTAIDNLLSA